ncbi:hypothetical protein LZ30DRAFT_814343 [Colletotrichum cereale]|nr:hypothetical protein LZ30DRAFT_814343 [Colletotrichum cereale]
MNCKTAPSRGHNKMIYKGLSLPNVKTIRLVNTEYFKNDTECLGDCYFLHNNCPKLRVVECSFKFDSAVDPTLLATPSDMLVALQPVATQLQRLVLTVETGSPLHNCGRIVSLAGFQDLRVVSIAIEFIEDLSLFVQLLPRSVSKLILRVGKTKVFTFLLTGMGQVLHVGAIEGYGI